MQNLFKLKKFLNQRTKLQAPTQLSRKLYQPLPKDLTHSFRLSLHQMTTRRTMMTMLQSQTTKGGTKLMTVSSLFSIKINCHFQSLCEWKWNFSSIRISFFFSCDRTKIFIFNFFVSFFSSSLCSDYGSKYLFDIFRMVACDRFFVARLWHFQASIEIDITIHIRPLWNGLAGLTSRASSRVHWRCE